MKAKRVVILIHGYNVSNPEGTVGYLRKPFESLGYKVVMLNYGYWPFTWQVTRVNPKVAQRLADLVFDLIMKGYTVDVAAHSNGCTITNLASNAYQIPINTFVAINPALRRKTHPCLSAKLVQVWHNGGDLPVVLGKWLRWLTPWAKKSRPWGEMGMDGYKGTVTDPRVACFDAGESFKIKAEGHSAVFKKPIRGFFLSRMAGYCFSEQTEIEKTDGAEMRMVGR